MSSDMKDARWGLAYYIARCIGTEIFPVELEYEDFTYRGWQKVLDEAQRRLDKYPEEIDMWAKEFRSE